MSCVDGVFGSLCVRTVEWLVVGERCFLFINIPSRAVCPPFAVTFVRYQFDVMGGRVTRGTRYAVLGRVQWCGNETTSNSCRRSTYVQARWSERSAGLPCSGLPCPETQLYRKGNVLTAQILIRNVHRALSFSSLAASKAPSVPCAALRSDDVVRLVSCAGVHHVRACPDEQ